jgi:hypothetical protein
MPGQPTIITVTPQRVESHSTVTPGMRTATLLLVGLVMANLALFPSIQQAASLPLTVPAEEPADWSLDAPRATYKPGAPKKVLLIHDSYRQMRSDVETFTQSVASIRQGIRQQIALSDVLIALRQNNPDITPEEAQQMLLSAGYDIPTPEVAEAMQSGSQFMQDDNAARAAFAQEIAQEIITDKIGGLLKNIELITRVGQYVLLDSPTK